MRKVRRFRLLKIIPLVLFLPLLSGSTVCAEETIIPAVGLDSILYAKSASLYYQYACQKCGTTITVAKTNKPPSMNCVKGGKHKWKRVSEK